MGQPTKITGYEPEWAIIAQQLTESESVTLSIGNAKIAARFRFRFYGFRKALEKHDPENPWITPLMESQATITPNGDLLLERNPYSHILRQVLNRSHISVPPPPAATPTSIEPDVVAGPSMPEHDQTILNILHHKDKPQ